MGGAPVELPVVAGARPGAAPPTLAPPLLEPVSELAISRRLYRPHPARDFTEGRSLLRVRGHALAH